MINEIFLGLAAILTSVISAVVGMAGGITLLSFMTFFLSWKEIIPVHGAVQFVSNGSRAWLLKKHVSLKILLPFLLGVPLGAFGAVFLVEGLVEKEIPLLLIAVLILYVLFKPKRLPKLEIPFWGFGLLGLIASFLGILIGATGPLLAPFFLRDDLKKENIVATKASCQILVHIVKFPSFFYLGFKYDEYLPLILIMTGSAVIGTYIGVRFLGRVSESFFRWLYKGALGLAVLRILYKVVF